MILGIFFMIYTLFALKKKHSRVSILLAILLTFSVVSGLLVGNTIELFTLKETGNLVFTILIMYILVSSFKKFRLTEIVNEHKQKVNVIFRVLIIVSLLCFIVNGFVFYKTINAGIEDFGAFKNTELGSEFRYSLPIPHFYISLASLLSPSSFFILSFAFYYLYLKEYRKSFWSFILSLNMPLQGFTMFSRSWTILYFLLLLVYVAFLYPTFNFKTKSILRKILLIITIPLILYFTDVTENRFEDSYEVSKESLIKNNSLYSILDYFSQWNKNGNYVMSNFYKVDKIQFANSSNTLLPEIGTLFGLNERKNLSEEREKIWPVPYIYTFNGLVANLVFDFGYLLTFILALIYRRYIISIEPKYGSFKIYNFLNLGIIITLPLMSFTNNYLANSFYNFAILYSVIIGIYFYVKIERD